MTKIYTRIINKKTTSVELKSILGRELYICNNGNWTDVLNEFSFSYTAEQFCQYIADYEAWAELNNVYVEILEGKAKHRKIINLVKEKLTDFFSEYDYTFFPKFYKTLSAKEKKAAEERKVSDLFVRTEFVGTEEGKETIERIKSVYNRQFSNGTLVIVGSIIAAQAYPGEVAAMTPVEGYERVAPDQKRMRCDKFTTFA